MYYTSHPTLIFHNIGRITDIQPRTWNRPRHVRSASILYHNHRRMTPLTSKWMPLTRKWHQVWRQPWLRDLCLAVKNSCQIFKFTMNSPLTAPFPILLSVKTEFGYTLTVCFPFGRSTWKAFISSRSASLGGSWASIPPCLINRWKRKKKKLFNTTLR